MGLIKIKNKYYLEIPEKIIEKYGVNLELVEVYPNLFVLKKQDNKQEKKIEELSDKEIILVKKLGKIKYDKRIKSKILKDLTKEEKNLLWNLIKKKVLFQYKKNNEWFLGISKDYFDKIILDRKQSNESKLLYKILEDENEIKNFDPKEFLMVKSFDKKIYLIHKELYNNIKDKVLSLLNKPKTVEEISKELNLNNDLIKCALEVLREIDCSVIEKEKDKYVRL